MKSFHVHLFALFFANFTVFCFFFLFFSFCSQGQDPTALAVLTQTVNGLRWYVFFVCVISSVTAKSNGVYHLLEPVASSVISLMDRVSSAKMRTASGQSDLVQGGWPFCHKTALSVWQNRRLPNVGLPRQTRFRCLLLPKSKISTLFDHHLFKEC